MGGETVHMRHPDGHTGRFSSGEAVVAVEAGNMLCPAELVGAALMSGFVYGDGRYVGTGETRESNPHAGARVVPFPGAPVRIAAIVGDDEAAVVIPAEPEREATTDGLDWGVERGEEHAAQVVDAIEAADAVSTEGVTTDTLKPAPKPRRARK